MNLENIMLTEISQTQEEKNVWFHLYIESKQVTYIEAMNRMMVTGAGIWEKWLDIYQGLNSCSYVG